VESRKEEEGNGKAQKAQLRRKNYELGNADCGTRNAARLIRKPGKQEVGK
jgi:hypothetical protein